MSDEIRLIVNGKTFKNWSGVTITQALDQAADAFSVEAPFDPERAELRQAFRPFGYQPVQVYLDDDLVLTGIIDKVEPKLSSDNRTLTVSGRSLAGKIIDCSIDGPLEYNFKFLADLAIHLCSPFGITVQWPNNRPIEGARATYGQTVYELLNSLAAPANLFLHSNPDGELVIFWGRELLNIASSASLVEGESPLLSVTASFDNSQRFSKYKAATQYGGESNIEGIANDSGVPINRPHLVIVGDADADPGQTASRQRTKAIASAVAVSASITGWRNSNGQLWKKGQAVTLKAPSVMLYKEAKYSIVGATMRIDTSKGKVTDLRLMLPEILGGEIPQVVPWE